MKIISIVVVALLLAGCGAWTRDNTTNAEFYQDRYECEQVAVRMYPPAIRSMGFQTPTKTDCTAYGNQLNCTTTPAGQSFGPIYDANGPARAGAIRSCLMGRGYSWR